METPSTARIALKWGIIMSVGIIIFNVVMFMTTLWKTPVFGFVPLVILLIGIIFSIREFKLLNNNFLNFGEGLGVGSLMSAVTGLITSIFSYLYATIIDTTIPQQLNDFEREKLEAQGTLSPEKIDEVMEKISGFMTSGMRSLLSLFILILMGFIFSLIVSMIFRKDKPEMDF